MLNDDDDDDDDDDWREAQRKARALKRAARERLATGHIGGTDADDRGEEEAAVAEVDPLAWLLRTEPQPHEYVPQVGDEVVYLRRGHERSVGAYPDLSAMPAPPYLIHPALPHAVRCRVLQIEYVPAGVAEAEAEAEAEKRGLVRLHVRLLALGASEPASNGDNGDAVNGGTVNGGAVKYGAELAPQREAISAACDDDGTPSGEEWLVTIPAPAAGCADFLVLYGKNVRVQRRLQMRRAGRSPTTLTRIRTLTQVRTCMRRGSGICAAKAAPRVGRYGCAARSLTRRASLCGTLGR